MHTKRIRIALTVICAFIIIAAPLFWFKVAVPILEEQKAFEVPFVINDTLEDGEGKEASVIILAGQSNASGCGSDEYLKRNVSPEKYAEYEAGYDNVYINYSASLSNRSDGFVKASVRQGEYGIWFGPELGMAEELHRAYPDRTFFIIKLAWGATNLRDHWLSPSSFGPTGGLYLTFINFVDENLEYLESKGYNVKLEALCWMQGESDSTSPEDAVKYEKSLKNFITDVRLRYEYYASEDGIAFIDATIAENPKLWIYYELLNESKRKVSLLSENNVLIDTDAAGLTTLYEPEDEPDIAHYDSMSQIKLGNLFAASVLDFLD